MGFDSFCLFYNDNQTAAKQMLLFEYTFDDAILSSIFPFSVEKQTLNMI